MMYFDEPGHRFAEHGFSMFPHILGMLICVAVLTLLVIFIVKHLRQKGGFSHYYQSTMQPGTGKAMEILNERYAKGEIGDDEYQKKKSEITKP